LTGDLVTFSKYDYDKLRLKRSERLKHNMPHHLIFDRYSVLFM